MRLQTLSFERFVEETGSMSPGPQTNLAGYTLTEFNEHIADPERYSGGGSVSAAAAASAASLSLLVLKLNRRRKRNKDVLEQIDADISRVRELREDFIKLVSHDAEILNRLMEQHQSRSGAIDSDYRAALIEAAGAPLELAEKCVQLVAIIHANAPRATRFTVADLGAAASISAACARSSLLMTDINVAMLEQLPDPPATELAAIGVRRATVVRVAATELDDVLAIVRSKLTRRSESKMEKSR